MTNQDTVLIFAEAEALVRMFACDFLDDAGFKVFEASGADEALLLLQARPDVRVLVTDVEMPGSMNGFELAHRVRERWPRIAIVVVSGRWRAAEADLPEGARFISKPYSPDLMVQVIRDCVSEAH